MSIKILNPLLTTQIAAGEVIERPASVVKELLENSLDAGSSKIDLAIVYGGIDLISVRDNGSGIPKEDLPLAIQRYATSKIANFEDLECIRSLGFRGEALASISAVSRLTLSSRTKIDHAGWKIQVAGQNISHEVIPIAHPFGTSIEVRDLFFNVPVRRKFLRSETTEFRQIEEIINRLALGRFDISFTLRRNERKVLDLPFALNITAQSERIANICGSDFADHAIRVNEVKGGFKLSGWISKPVFSRSQADLHYFYVNGRIVRDKLISHAVKLAYQDVLPTGRQPIVILYLELDPKLLDVNVHPAKYEIRFRESRTTHDFLVHALRRCLASSFPNPEQLKDSSANSQNYLSIHNSLPSSDNSSPQHHREGSSFSSFSTKTNEEKDSTSHSTNQNSISQMNLPFSENKYSSFRSNKNYFQPSMAKHTAELEIFNPNYLSRLTRSAYMTEQKPFLGYALAQFYGTYILAQNGDGLILVDIHAAHERIVYERLKRDYAGSNIEMQNLLMLLTISISKQEMILFEEHQECLKSLGLEIERFGEDEIIVRKTPLLLGNCDPSQLVRDLLADLNEHESYDSMETYIDKILSLFACHHAIRAKQKLSNVEMNVLLRQLEQSERADVCSHGRPTWVKITLSEIHKMFKRNGAGW